MLLLLLACDPDTPAGHANAPCVASEEVCDGVDNDCDDLVDDADAKLIGAFEWHEDADADGFGDAASAERACSAPDGFVADATDCDDGDPTVSPDADETCDELDDDCDGRVDDADDDLVDAPSWYWDADGDGFGSPSDPIDACVAPAGYIAVQGDCEDHDDAVNPGADERCNGFDDDCDARMDADDDSLTDGTAYYPDADDDHFGDTTNPIVACSPPEGYTEDGTDCDDTSRTVNPLAIEVCDDVDDDCDGLTDGQDDSLHGGSRYYEDADADGFGDAASADEACSAPDGFVADGTDCDDGAAWVNPAAIETCDGIDDDCDTLIDGQDASVEGAGTWYTDTDGDGYGDDETAIVACTAPSDSIPIGGDCDDASADVNPGAVEVCDDLDNDCDGRIDGQDDSLADGTIYFADADGDGYGDPTSSATSCSEAPGYVDNSLDLDDGDVTLRACPAGARNPSQWELDVPRDSVISIDADLDPATVTSDSFVVYGDVSGFIPGTVTYSSGRAGFTPDQPAQPGERVTAVLTGAVTCTTGGSPGPKIWSWTAAADAGTAVMVSAGEYWTGASQSYGIGAWDLDGDGDLEIATNDYEVPTVTIVDGAPGSYSVLGQVAFDGMPMSIDGGDVDGDGDIDLVSVDGVGAEVLMNDGNGSFADPVAYNYSGTYASYGVQLGDMDGDGDLDLVAGAGAIVVLANDGGGSFSGVSYYSTGGTCAIELGDVDNDDDLDVVAPHCYDLGVSVLANDGRGNLSELAGLTAGGTPKNAFVDDLNGDGFADIAVPELYGEAVDVMIGDGAGGFSTTSTRIVRPHGICGGDLDADGDIDLGVPVYDVPGSVATLLNDGFGAFTVAETQTISAPASAAFCADLDGDGALDIVVSGAGSGGSSTVTAWLNTP